MFSVFLPTVWACLPWWCPIATYSSSPILQSQAMLFHIPARRQAEWNFLFRPVSLVAYRFVRIHVCECVRMCARDVLLLLCHIYGNEAEAASIPFRFIACFVVNEGGGWLSLSLAGMFWRNKKWETNCPPTHPPVPASNCEKSRLLLIIGCPKKSRTDLLLRIWLRLRE